MNENGHQYVMYLVLALALGAANPNRTLHHFEGCGLCKGKKWRLVSGCIIEYGSTLYVGVARKNGGQYKHIEGSATAHFGVRDFTLKFGIQAFWTLHFFISMSISPMISDFTSTSLFIPDFSLSL